MEMLKQVVRKAAGSFGLEVRRRQPPIPTGPEVQKTMFGASGDLVIFDVGAHEGWTVANFRKLFPGAFIHAFEPTPAAAEHLKTRYIADARVQCHAVALTDQEGTVDLNLNVWGTTNSLLRTDAAAPASWSEHVNTKMTIKVPTRTIDAFCAANNVSNIDILKIDVQGAENRVLKGAYRKLSSGSIKSVYLEVIVAPTYVGQARPDEIFGMLYEAGLVLIDVYDLWRDGAALLQFDALFALPQYAQRLRGT